jgi:hypothetical protein
MKVMVLVKSTPEMEVSMASMPAEGMEEMYREMGSYNEELVKAGVMLSGEGLLPSSAGYKVKFTTSGGREVKDGPFTEAKELVAGFWIWQVKDMAEALDWIKRMPNPMNQESEVELRQIAGNDDLPDMPQDVKELEDRLRNKLGTT